MSVNDLYWSAIESERKPYEVTMKQASDVILEMRDSLNEQVRHLDKKFEFLATYGGEIESLVEAFNEKLPNTEFVVDTDSLDISLTGDKATLGLAFSILRRADLVPDNRPGDEHKTEFYTFFRADPTNESGFKVWFSFTSTVCKTIQVGTKTVEVPIYEVVCE